MVKLRIASIRTEPSRVGWRIVVITSCLAALCSACASSGGAIDIDQLAEDPQPAAGQYVIDVGDVLNIQVFDQEKMSGKIKVRSDGRISLPLVNEIDAAGKTPAVLTAEIEGSLKKLILVPQVTVSVEETSPLTISILGEVAKPGPHELPRGSGLSQALAAAGGLTNFAKKDQIFVVRASPKPIRIHFDYERLTRAIGRAVAFRLRSGDVVVVE